MTDELAASNQQQHGQSPQSQPAVSASQRRRPHGQYPDPLGLVHSDLHRVPVFIPEDSPIPVQDRTDSQVSSISQSLGDSLTRQSTDYSASDWGGFFSNDLISDAFEELLVRERE
ncbi:hypothetical protein E4U53_005304 [Claviceps sorghi]|nr:hypothetical protein E4U53_005304 [Claviceps sorghi]